jgi:hypothetical protein
MGHDDQGNPRGTTRPLTEEDVVERIDDAGANQPVDEHEPAAERREPEEGEEQNEAFQDTLERAAGHSLDDER